MKTLMTCLIAIFLLCICSCEKDEGIFIDNPLFVVEPGSAEIPVPDPNKPPIFEHKPPGHNNPNNPGRGHFKKHGKGHLRKHGKKY